jgi:phosphatidate cytidylyltransferase
MAFNWSTFKTRAVSALLFVVLMLSGLLWNQWSFLILFSIVHFGCWWEYQKLIRSIDHDYTQINPFHKYGMMVAGFGGMLFFTNDWFLTETISLHSIGASLFLVGILIVPVSEMLVAGQHHLKNMGYSFLGLLYISLSWALLLHIRSGALWMPNHGADSFSNLSASLATISGYVLPLIIIGSIWINDTMAYLTGSLIGKTPLSVVSPKKTWEGTMGGIVLSVLTMLALGYAFSSSEIWLWGTIAGIAAVTGTVGDLLESKLKRMAGVKDSGQILPGHGGFLDRFDSLLLAVPFVWVFLKLME